MVPVFNVLSMSSSATHVELTVSISSNIRRLEYTKNPEGLSGIFVFELLLCSTCLDRQYGLKDKH